MKNTKKIIISFAISLVILIIIQIIFGKVFKNENVEIYVATKDIYKGEKIIESSLKKIKVQKNNNIKNYYNVDIVNKFAKINIVSGKVLENSDVVDKVNKESVENYEYITLEIKNISSGLAYQLKEGDFVNVYYTAKEKDIKGVLGEKETLSSVGDNKTIKIFENIKVEGLYDSLGNKVNEQQYNAIMLRVSKDDAMLISNIKQEGEFNISLIK